MGTIAFASSCEWFVPGRHRAEPFIGHFPDRQRAFASITRRVPFYMGVTLLRIARNSWFNNDYRRILIDEAKNILK